MAIIKRGVSNVYKQVIDLSERIMPTVNLNVACIIDSRVGPCEYITENGDETTLIKHFGKPTDANFEEWYMASRVWLYRQDGMGANVLAVRPVNAGSKNGGLTITSTEVVAASTGLLIKNKDEHDFATIVFDEGSDSSAGVVKFHMAFPTDLDYKIAVATVADFATADIKPGVSFASNFEVAPEGTEIAICVLDPDGNIINSEKRIVDLTPGNVDGYDQDTYIENVINHKSNYIFADLNAGQGTDIVSFEATSFVEGAYVEATASDKANALALFENPEAVQVNYFIANPELHAETITATESRGDAAWRAGIPVSQLIGVDMATALQNVQTYTGTTLSTSSNYGSMNANALYIEDTYNNKKRWINVAGDIVGLRCQQNLRSAPWYSEAGLNYGQLREVIKLAQYWDIPAQKTLNGVKCNPIILKAGKGIIKSEQNNYTVKPSALRAENVRELINYIWIAGKAFLEWKLHEFNDEYTRANITSQMTRFLKSVQDGRGIRKTESGGDGFRVVCDSSNNTDDIISQEILVVEIAFLPARVATEIFFVMKVMDNSVQLEQV